MGKVKSFGVLIAATLTCVCIAGGSVLAEEGEFSRSSRITSKGTVKYADGAVVISSSDLTYLADEIDSLERAYKSKTVEALNGIGTFYASASGEISHDPGDSNVSSDGAAVLSFRDLYRGIEESQSVDYLADVQAADEHDSLLYYADENAAESGDLIAVTADANDFPLLIRAASAGNLTAGTAAWVDGEILIGNGADNRAYYNEGYSDGYDEGYDQGHSDGYEEGYDQGHSDGYEEGYEQGHSDGYEEGYKQGRSDGYEEGYDRGRSDGYKEGYDKGHSDGYKEGYDKGHSDGYDKGYNQGRSEGYNEGYDAGYDAGRNAAIPVDSLKLSLSLIGANNDPSGAQIPIAGAKKVEVQINQQATYNWEKNAKAVINGIELEVPNAVRTAERTWTEQEIGDATILYLTSKTGLNETSVEYTYFTVTIYY